MWQTYRKKGHSQDGCNLDDYKKLSTVNFRRYKPNWYQNFLQILPNFPLLLQNFKFFKIFKFYIIFFQNFLRISSHFPQTSNFLNFQGSLIPGFHSKFLKLSKVFLECLANYKPFTQPNSLPHYFHNLISESSFWLSEFLFGCCVVYTISLTSRPSISLVECQDSVSSCLYRYLDVYTLSMDIYISHLSVHTVLP